MDKMQALNLFLKKRNSIIYISVFLLSLLLSRKVYQAQMRKYNQLVKAIKTGEEKIKALDHIINLNEKIKKFRDKSWDTVDTNLIIGKIFNIGLESQVKIRDIAPETKKDEKNYVLLPFSLTCEASYKTLVKFVKILETYPMLWRVKAVAAQPVSEEAARFRDKDVLLKVGMNIDAIYLK